MNYWKLIYILFLLGFLRLHGFIVRNTIFRKPDLIEESKIGEINGFYGLVGPNIDISKTDTLYKLFTGDGIIHGIFLENGQISEVSHIVQTEKVQHEKIHGKFLNGMMVLPMYMFMNKMGMIPNVMGLANTAFIKVKEKIYVLFERDLPYEISLNFHTKKVETIKKVKIENINHFSAHSTFDEKTNIVYSLEYNVLRNIVSLLYMDEHLNLKNKIDVKTKYIPIVHDSYVLSNSIIFTDSPLRFSIKNLILRKIPVTFDKMKPTFIHEICKETGFKNIYSCKESFYIFHYAEMVETDERIEILAAVYDELDFSEINISGKYRRLILDKMTNTVEIERNEELETYNLDFPMKWRDSMILRNIENNRINGFIICKGLDVQRRIFIKDISICGEPMVYDDGSFSRIICLGYDGDMRGYFILIDPEDGRIFQFPLTEKVNIGFHSIFVGKP